MACEPEVRRFESSIEAMNYEGSRHLVWRDQGVSMMGLWLVSRVRRLPGLETKGALAMYLAGFVLRETLLHELAKLENNVGCPFEKKREKEELT